MTNVPFRRHASSPERYQSELEQLVQELKHQLNDKQRALMASKAGLQHISRLYTLQKQELENRVVKLESDFQESVVKKNAQMERRRIQYTNEISQLNEDFATLSKSSTKKKRGSSKSDIIMERLTSVSLTLQERNEIISSLEEALERVSIDRDRLRRERDFLDSHVKFLETTQNMPEPPMSSKQTEVCRNVQSLCESVQRKRRGKVSSDICREVDSQSTIIEVEAGQSKMHAVQVRNKTLEVCLDFFGANSTNIAPLFEEPRNPQENFAKGQLQEKELTSMEPRPLNIVLGTARATLQDGEDLLTTDNHASNTAATDLKENICQTNKRDGLNTGHGMAKSADIQGLTAVLSEMEEIRGKGKVSNARRVVDNMTKHIYELELENQQHEVQRLILEKNRNLLEESIRRLELQIQICKDRKCCQHSADSEGNCHERSDKHWNA